MILEVGDKGPDQLAQMHNLHIPHMPQRLSHTAVLLMETIVFYVKIIIKLSMC